MDHGVTFQELESPWEWFKKLHTQTSLRSIKIETALDRTKHLCFQKPLSISDEYSSSQEQLARSPKSDKAMWPY